MRLGLASALLLALVGKYGWHPGAITVNPGEVAHRLSKAAGRLTGAVPLPCLPQSPSLPSPAQKLARTTQALLSGVRKAAIGLSSLLGIGGLVMLTQSGKETQGEPRGRRTGVPPMPPPLYLWGDQPGDQAAGSSRRTSGGSRVSAGSLPAATTRLGHEEWKERFQNHFQRLANTTNNQDEKKKILKKEYRRLILIYHPDKCPNADLDSFKALQAAYAKQAGISENEASPVNLFGFSASAFDFLAKSNSRNRNEKREMADQVPTLVTSQIKPAFEGTDEDAKEEALYHFEECLWNSALAERGEARDIEEYQAHIGKLQEYLNHPQMNLSAGVNQQYQEALRYYQEKVTALSQKNRAEERINAIREFLQVPEVLDRLEKVEYRPAAYDENQMVFCYDFGDAGSVALRPETEDNDKKLYSLYGNLYGNRSPLPAGAMRHFTKTTNWLARGWSLKRKQERT